MSNDKQTWYCKDCGSRDIRHDAIVRFNIEKQAWDVLSLLDNSWCESCTMSSEPLARSGSPVFGTPPVMKQEH